ncbi:hypothetical protein [Streptomyces neyagawaensis]|uniref:hypothetical protein n=1 Tax=Streptomyces neyagawaensis TaxID=42238 RepID=UPI0006E30856|nr:hypothetical protein [Streptomyces neyagawaensis]MCL6733382.1 hypothetical protein [Streptomyces neyagawaensis]MDE1685185.1 hypothetical protein [Streptomyces neyagawaensis]
MHSSTRSRRIGVLALLGLGSAAAALVLGTAVDAPAGTRLAADDAVTEVVVPPKADKGGARPGVVVPGHKETWTWDDQE